MFSTPRLPALVGFSWGVGGGRMRGEAGGGGGGWCWGTNNVGCQALLTHAHARCSHGVCDLANDRSVVEIRGHMLRQSGVNNLL